jgi:membrane protease YdiL (CAAX protease family)
VIIANNETLRAWHIVMAFVVMFLSGFPLYFFELVILDVTDVHIPEQLFTAMFNTGCGLCAVFYLMKKYPLNYKLSQITPNIQTIIVWGGLGGIAISFSNFPYAAFFGGREPESVFLIPLEEGFGYIAILMVLAAIVQPILEELLFRFYIYTFLKGQFSTSTGYIGTSLLFTMFHPSSSPLMLMNFVHAIVFTYLYEETGLIETSILAHMIVNAVWFSSVYYYLMFIH